MVLNDQCDSRADQINATISATDEINIIGQF